MADHPPVPPNPALTLPPRGPMGLIGLNGLKPRAPPPPKLVLVEKDLTEETLASKQWKMTASARMRYLDDIRKHSPLPDEASFLNIPEGRLDLHILKSVLYICGGCAGARFTTGDFGVAKELICVMEQTWANMDKSFKGLSSAQKKFVLDEAFVVPPSPPTSATDEESQDEQDEDEEKEEGEREIDRDRESLPEGVDAEIVAFHRLADEWSRHARTLQDLVRLKQASLPSAEERKALIATFASGDPDGLDQAKMMPDWLEILLEKYRREGVPKVLRAVAGNAINKDGSSPNAMQSNPETIGKFSVFLSWAVVGKLSCGEPSHAEALMEVLQASNDAHLGIPTGMRLAAIVAKEKSGQGQGQEYWAQRLFSFIKQVRELKSMVKEEKALHYPWIWLEE